MQKTLEERIDKTRLDLFAAEQHFHKRLDALNVDMKDLQKELDLLRKPKEIPLNIVFDKLVEKYWVDFADDKKIDNKYKTKLNNGSISIDFPPANINWTFAIMQAAMEFCKDKKYRVSIDGGSMKINPMYTY